MYGRGMPVYAGAAYQRGHGLGRVMKNIMRHATPILKQAGSQALKMGISVLANGVLGHRRYTGQVTPGIGYAGSGVGCFMYTLEGMKHSSGPAGNFVRNGRRTA